MTKRFLCGVFALLALVGVSTVGPAQAAHPLITDDTGTQGKGKYQLEMNAGISRDKETLGGVETREVAGEAAVSFSVGVTDDSDLIVGFPWIASRLEGNGTLVSDQSGPGDMSVEAKWRFFRREGFSLAVKPGVTVPIGDEKKGFGNGRASYGVTLIAAQEWERFSIYANGAYTRNEFKLDVDKQTNRRDIWHASMAAVVEATKDLKVVANIGMESNGDRTSSRWPAFLLGGAIYSLTEDFDVDLGIKWGLSGPEPDLALLGGLAWRF